MSLTRYRIGEEAGAPTVTDDMMLLTTLYGLLVGILLTFIARRLRQRWMVFWGGGLSALSLAYLLAYWVGWI
ncbi:MAG TPA: hypothetical protein DHW07_04640 [Gammaproteobacteria bacterium]|nr:hypothetical protein [Gammaproteobacteria bacterium]